MPTSKPPEFNLGTVVITSGVDYSFEEIAKFMFPDESGNPMLLAIIKCAMRDKLLGMHRRLEKGLLDEEDYHANFDALKHEGDSDMQLRVFSHFEYGDIRFYVITEHDRSYTTILLPEEY